MKSAIRTSVLATVAVLALSASSAQIASADVLDGSQSAGTTASANHVGGCNPYPYPPPSPKLTLSFGSIMSIVGLYFGL